jgi:hypothetical protein
MLTKVARLTFATAVLACFLAVPGSAQTLNRRTVFTFTGPVSIPGVTLPAGTYLFQISSPNTSANVVQVLSADGQTPYGMFFTLPTYRLDAASTPEVQLMEAGPGLASAIKTWWFGETTGYEFMYPEDQARKLADSGAHEVLTTRGQRISAN